MAKKAISKLTLEEAKEQLVGLKTEMSATAADKKDYYKENKQKRYNPLFLFLGRYHNNPCNKTDEEADCRSCTEIFGQTDKEGRNQTCKQGNWNRNWRLAKRNGFFPGGFVSFWKMLVKDQVCQQGNNHGSCGNSECPVIST